MASAATPGSVDGPTGARPAAGRDDVAEDAVAEDAVAGAADGPRTARGTSRELVHRTARRLFAERGYADVSIRDIAAAAGVSPALVIKHGVSKQEMFRNAISFEPTPVIAALPVDDLGRGLVRRILDAHRSGRPAPLTRAVVLVLPSPDPDELRARFDAAYLEPLTERLGGGDDARRRAETALAALTGLSVSLRVFHHNDDPHHDAELVERYGAAVQALLDA